MCPSHGRGTHSAAIRNNNNNNNTTQVVGTNTNEYKTRRIYRKNI